MEWYTDDCTLLMIGYYTEAYARRPGIQTSTTTEHNITGHNVHH